MICSKYKRPEREPEYNDRHIITEQAGHVTTKKLIQGMMSAGQRLMDWRKNQYDLPEDASDDEIDRFDDPTRRSDFDIVDAEALVEAANRRLKEAKENAKKHSGDNREDKENRGDGDTKKKGDGKDSTPPVRGVDDDKERSERTV